MTGFLCRLSQIALCALACFSTLLQAAPDGGKPYLLLVSIDGFRWDYFDQYPTPALHSLAARGVKADSLLPVFPTLTFPNHYSIATGLFPQNHGLVANEFPDRDSGDWYIYKQKESAQDGRWYGGEPIWVAAKKAGMNTAAFFFVGSEAPIQGVLPDRWNAYDKSISGDERVTQVLHWPGGPESTTVSEAPVAPRAVFELGVPVLGICYGMQTMAKQLGGRVATSDHREFGYAEVTATAPCRLFDGIADREDGRHRAVLDVWMSHGDRVEALPQGFTAVGVSANAPLAAMADEGRRYYGVQFHPEVTHTKQGARLLERFVRDICGAQALWTVGNIIEDAIARVRSQVGEGRVLLGLSGGVDSSVVAALLHRAIGDRLVCVFVDHGLLREGEGDQVMRTFAENLGVRVIRVNAAPRYFAALAGVTDPEQKRKIIGRLFIEIFDEEAHKLEGIAFLAQGTIYPDVIESAGARTGKAHVIKSHHNVGGLPENMRMQLVEPLRELFKDEVRELGG